MSDDNPFAAPTANNSSPDVIATEDRDYLRKIAVAQRPVNLVVLAYLCCVPFNVVLGAVSENAPWAGIVMAIIGLTILGCGADFVFQLAAIFRRKVVATIYVLGVLVPLLGLLLLASVSQMATAILRQHQIKVGLLGANPDAI